MGWDTRYENNTESFLKGAPRTKKSTATRTANKGSYEARLTADKTDKWYGRAYVIYSWHGKVMHTAYSDVVAYPENEFVLSGNVFSENSEPNAALTVEYEMDSKVKTPDSTFRFIFAKNEADSILVSNDKHISENSMPDIADIMVSFTTEDKGTGDAKKIVKKVTNNFLADFKTAITENAENLYSPGWYTYTITQSKLAPDGDSNIAFNHTSDKATLSVAEYKVTITVALGRDGLYVKRVKVWQKKMMKDRRLRLQIP